MTRRTRVLLTATIVHDIRNLLNEGKSNNYIRTKHKVSDATIGRIRHIMEGGNVTTDTKNIARLLRINPQFAEEPQREDTHGLTGAVVQFGKTLDEYTARLVELDDLLADVLKKAKTINNLL